MVLPQATLHVSNGNNIVTCNFGCLATKWSNLPMTTTQLVIFKPGHQTFIAPHSTDNHSKTSTVAYLNESLIK